MFLDDDYPDYFLGDDADTPQASGAQNASGSPSPGQADRPVRPGETITFTDQHHDVSTRRDTPSGNDDAGGFLTGRGRRSLGCGCLIVVVIALAIAYFRYLSPCVDDAVMDVCVTHIEKRGVFFKTYEAEIVFPDRLDDDSPDGAPYTRPSSVTVADPAVAERLGAIQATGKPVRLRYRRYYGTLPWRGESKTVITGITD